MTVFVDDVESESQQLSKSFYIIFSIVFVRFILAVAIWQLFSVHMKWGADGRSCTWWMVHNFTGTSKMNIEKNRVGLHKSNLFSSNIPNCIIEQNKNKSIFTEQRFSRSKPSNEFTDNLFIVHLCIHRPLTDCTSGWNIARQLWCGSTFWIWLLPIKSKTNMVERTEK